MSIDINIDSIESLYKALDDRDEIKAKALLMLMLRNWLTEVSSFDPVSGHALHTGIVDFMDVVAKSMQDESHESEIKDRIYRIVSHTKEAVLAIMEHTRDKILREHAMLPIHTAREIDSKSVQWLSRKPGRTLREKLSGKPYIKAVRRISSVDTAENRLLRAFLFRLEQILIERQNALAAATEDICEELLVSLQRWLRSEDSAEIGVWGNLPPNNTLLQDKRYRKVWDGWLWLQYLDENIEADNKRIHNDILSVIYWETLSLLNQTGSFRTVQQPVNLDYDNFGIIPSRPVTGFLFPIYESNFKGQIKNIDYGKMVGLITNECGIDLFFFNNNLSKNIDITSLKVGDAVFFEIRSNSQGDWAVNIQFTADPEPFDFRLSHDRFDILLGKKEFSVQIDSDGISLIQKQEDSKKKFQLNLSALKEIPETILSLLTDARFDPLIVDNKNKIEQMDVSVLDLCSIRPLFLNNAGTQILPFRLLLQNWKSKKLGDEYYIDCGESKVIAFHSDIETVSMRSLFMYNSTISNAVRSSASMFFTKKLRDYILAGRLTYLVPDWGNDFDLDCIRKSVNFYFEDTTPLPKSIAAIFAWHSSIKFELDNVRENDFVLVIDSFDGGVSITPVQAIFQKDLAVILPETQGIIWERHPTVIVPNRNIHIAMARNLAKDGCQISEELIQLFGFDGLASDAAQVSFVRDDHWYHLPGSIREVLTHDLDLNILSNYAIGDCLNSTSRYCRGVNAFILPLDDTIKKPDLRKDYKWLGSAGSLIKGCQTLNVWQEEVDDIALWRDHLPELSFKDIPQQITDKFFWWDDFNLVKDVPVIPRKGRCTNIAIDKVFILPVNHKEPINHYSFGLSLGKGKKELHYVAYLKSPAFPLKETTKCKLKMTYTYGADDPYELKFIPSDSEKAGFKSIRVEWRSAAEGDTTDLGSLPIPDFPTRKTWVDFQKFPKEDGKSFSDLLEWVESKWILLDSAILREEIIGKIVERKVSILKSKRVSGTFKWGTTNNKGNYYCFVDVGGEDIYCSASSFKENTNCDSLQEGQIVYLNIVKKQDSSFGVNVSFYDEFPIGIAKEIHEYERRRLNISSDEIIQRYAELLEKALRSLHFPVLTIWNNGHSLSEPDVPNNFRTAIFEGIDRAFNIIDSENIHDTLKEELFFFLSCLHKDAPGIVGTRLLDAAQDGQLLKKNNKNIAFAIGNAELPWQQQLLRNIISPIDNEGLIRSITLEDLAIALWRSEELIFKLSEMDLKKLSNDLFRCIQFDMQLLTAAIPKHRLQTHLEKGLAESEAHKRERSYQTNTLCKHLELLLALLRSRKSIDEELKMILTPEKELTKKYVSLIDEVSKIVIDNKIQIKSRINLQIKKPEMFSNAPDLLYALRMYLTGDDGAHNIIISGISEEE